MLSAHLTLGRRWTLVAGKGGVGKTTVAAALALELADCGEEILVASVDPAHSLGDALGLDLVGEPRWVPDAPPLLAMEIDAEREHARLLQQHGGDLSAVLERGTYLDAADVSALTETPVPGADELAALLALAEVGRTFQGRVILDTAPTGHTLRLLELPALAIAWLDALDEMEGKHETIASSLGSRAGPDGPAAFLARLREDVEAISARLADPDDTRVVLVTTGEKAVGAETERYLGELARLGIHTGGTIVNRGGWGAEMPPAAGEPRLQVPELDEPLVGLAGLRRFARSASAEPLAVGTPGRRLSPGDRPDTRPFDLPPPASLYVVGGKGGAGKSTVACALAIRLAGASTGDVLLLSVDPAGSLGDLLRVPVGPVASPHPGVLRLYVQQMDAAAAWENLVAADHEVMSEALAGLLGSPRAGRTGGSLADRVLDLTPPGLDELMALMEVMDAREDRPYDAIVLDTAPTGHLLRLLEAPALALEWTHVLMRLLLRYREVVRLAGAGERVLEMARELRAFQARLRDPASTWFLGVALPESLGVPETRRLVEALERLGIRPGALLVNRALDASGGVRRAAAGELRALREGHAGLPLILAPACEPAPVGAQALIRFSETWRVAAPATGRAAVSAPDD